MFDGLKILCLSPDSGSPFKPCLNPVIVPEDKFLKVANTPFECPACGRKNRAVNALFRQVLSLRKAVREFDDRSSFNVGKYGLFYANACQKDEPLGIAEFLETEDWSDWNNQVSNISFCCKEEPGIDFDAWEDHFFKSRPFVHPGPDYEITFGSILKRKALFIPGYEVTHLNLLKTVLKEVRLYNRAWASLLYSGVNAAPVDLRHPLYLSMNKVENLAELYPGEVYE